MQHINIVNKLLVNLLDAPQSDLVIYKLWITLYIMGDRVRSDVLFDTQKDTIIKVATMLRTLYPVEEVTLYRGILLDPRNSLDTHNLWRYSHVSFTANYRVAEAFSTIDNIYGSVFPSHYIGHILEHTLLETDTLYFSYTWAYYLGEDFYDFISIWNQEEYILHRSTI